MVLEDMGRPEAASTSRVAGRAGRELVPAAGEPARADGQLGYPEIIGWKGAEDPVNGIEREGDN